MILRTARLLVPALALVVLAGNVTTSAGPSQSPAPAASDLVLHFNQRLEPSDVFLSYLLRGSFGVATAYGVHDTGLTWIGASDLALDTTRKDLPATSARIVIYCRGYRLAAIDVPVIASARRHTVELVPLATVPLRGRVLLFGRDVSQLTLDVNYDASDMVLGTFFPDGHFAGSFISSTFRVATVPLRAEGFFEAQVPDFMKDPMAAGRPGAFTSFSLVGPRGPSLLSGITSQNPRVPLANTYDQLLVLTTGPR